MTLGRVQQFMEANHRGVIATFRKNGAAQASIVASGWFQDAAVFVALGKSVKLTNLRRDPRGTMLRVKPDWSEYTVVEGRAEIRGPDNMDQEELRILLRDAYKACGGDHPDWDEYDRVMKEDRRAVVTVKPDHAYGFWR